MNISTIAAIATPPGDGGIGIIKLSGPDAISLALSIFIPFRSAETFSPKPWRMYYGHITDPETGLLLDEALLVTMPAPFSQTGENIAEIQLHAGSLILQTILHALVQCGASLAQPGEFTRRAFQNGRIDLTQAESIIDLIHAKSIASLHSAAALTKGELKDEIHQISRKLQTALAQLEAAIDFPDDIEEANGFFDKSILLTEISHLQTLIQLHLNNNPIRERFHVVIAGPPNAGKSSLLNLLSNMDRAIVSDIPGTTRDHIDVTLQINGVTITLTDTAGIHGTQDPLEHLGIQRTYACLEQADIVLYLLDIGQSITPLDISCLESLQSKKHLILVNKIDLPKHHHCLILPPFLNDASICYISVLFNQGIDQMKTLLHQFLKYKETLPSLSFIPNLRHRLCLENALHSLQTSLQNLELKLPPEIISIDIKEALHSLLEITGETAKPDILDAIFSQFCIGK